jgi:hypothetical protein
MTFAKVYDNDRYGRIVVMNKQDINGAPEIRFFFQPEGCGVSEFAFGSGDDAESIINEAFDNVTDSEVIEIIDGYLGHIASQESIQ